MEVVRLKTLKDQDKEALLEKLAKYLLLAEEGKITGVVITAILEGGGVQSGYVGDWVELLGALRVAEHDIMEDSVATCAEEPDGDE